MPRKPNARHRKKKKGGCRDRRPVAVTKMPRDGLARDLEVEAALAAEAAWGLKETVASMAGSIDMDVYSPLHLPIELGGNGSISANKVIMDGEQSLEVPTAKTLDDTNEGINRLIAMQKRYGIAAI